MRCKIIKSYSPEDFEDKVNEAYKDYYVKEVQTHTQYVNERPVPATMYIAFVFYKSKVEGTDIEDIMLSHRTINALKRAGINTLEELQANLSNVKHIRNLGAVSYNEIIRVLNNLEK